MKEEQSILIKYRLEQADASLKEAEVLLREKISFRLARVSLEDLKPRTFSAGRKSSRGILAAWD